MIVWYPLPRSTVRMTGSLGSHSPYASGATDRLGSPRSASSLDPYGPAPGPRSPLFERERNTGTPRPIGWAPRPSVPEVVVLLKRVGGEGYDL